jgi:hypothetical protein
VEVATWPLANRINAGLSRQRGWARTLTALMSACFCLGWCATTCPLLRPATRLPTSSCSHGRTTTVVLNLQLTTRHLLLPTAYDLRTNTHLTLLRFLFPVAWTLGPPGMGIIGIDVQARP